MGTPDLILMLAVLIPATVAVVAGAAVHPVTEFVPAFLFVVAWWVYLVYRIRHVRIDLTDIDIALLSDISLWSVDISPDGRCIAAGTGTGRVFLLDAVSGTERYHVKVSGRVTSVAFSPDGRFLAVASIDMPRHAAEVTAWQVDTGDAAGTLTDLPGFSTHIAFSPDSTRVALAAHIQQTGEDAVLLWSVGAGETSHHPLGAGNTSLCFAFSPDGRFVAAGLQDGSVRVLDSATGHLSRTLVPSHSMPPEDQDEDEERVMALAYAPDGSVLASVGGKGAVRLWDLHEGQAHSLALSSTETVLAATFSPDGSVLVTGSDDGAVRLWDVRARGLLRTLYQDARTPVVAVAYASRGAHVVAGAADGTILLWDTATERLVRRVKVH